MIENITSPEQIKSLLWVSKAAYTQAENKRLPRDPLTCIFVEGGKIVATNGKALHIWQPELCPLESGLYDIITAKKDGIVLKKAEGKPPYPNYKQVIPKDFDCSLKIDFMGAETIGLLMVETLHVFQTQKALNAVGYGTIQAPSKQLKGVGVYWDQNSKSPIKVCPEADKFAILMPTSVQLQGGYE